MPVENNLFNVICEELAKTDRNEYYLVADEVIEVLGASPVIRDAIAQAESIEHGELGVTAIITLTAHFYASNNFRGMSCRFDDGATGVIDVDGVAVQFSIHKISRDRAAFRVLFSKIDAVKLHTKLEDEVRAMARRLDKLECVIRV